MQCLKIQLRWAGRRGLIPKMYQKYTRLYPNIYIYTYNRARSVNCARLNAVLKSAAEVATTLSPTHLGEKDFFLVWKNKRKPVCSHIPFTSEGNHLKPLYSTMLAFRPSGPYRERWSNPCNPTALLLKVRRRLFLSIFRSIFPTTTSSCKLPLPLIIASHLRSAHS